MGEQKFREWELEELDWELRLIRVEAKRERRVL